jgi:putative oxidoreductase
MAYGILLLRLVLGPTMAAHGAQKLLGTFGGPGPEGAAELMAKLRSRAPLAAALAAGAAELGGGLLLAAGLLTPLAIAVVMLNAIGTVHLRNGFFVTSGGYEYNLVAWAAAVALGLAGSMSGLWWGVGVALGGALVSLLLLTAGRRPASPLAAVGEEAPRRAA